MVEVEIIFNDALFIYEGSPTEIQQPLSIKMKCFIGHRPNFYKDFGVDGYLGLAPMVESLKENSFLWKMKQ